MLYSTQIKKGKLERVYHLLRDSLWTLENSPWCKGSFAIDEKGEEVSPRAKEAAAVCAVGALKVNTKSEELVSSARNILDETVQGLRSRIPDYDRTGIVEYNDNSQTRRREVLHVFRKAIKEVRQALKKM